MRVSKYEPHIVINSDRTIVVPDKLKHIAVQFDHKIETVTFDCPRYWDNHDFSKMHAYINYMRQDGYKDQYPATNMRVDDSDESIIHFEWTITRNVTPIKGNVSFLVCIKNAEDDEPHWNSRLNQDLIIDEGMECTEQVVESNPDIIEDILSRMEVLELSGGGTVTDEQIASAVEDYMTEHPMTGVGLTEEQIIALDNMFKVCAFTKADVSAEYNAFCSAFGIEGGNVHTHSYTSVVTTAATCETAGVRTYTCSCGHSYNETIPATGHNYVDGVCTVCGATDPTYNPEVTLTSISATYSGEDVSVGTAVSDLTGIVVTAHYSDGSTAPVNGYTLSGTIAEGNNTITVTYQGMTATFIVTGVAESGGDSSVTTLSLCNNAGYIKNDGVSTAAVSNGYHSDNIEAATIKSAKTKYRTAFITSGFSAFWFYDADGNVLSGTNGTTSEVGSTYSYCEITESDIPADAKYVKIVIIYANTSSADDVADLMTVYK